MPPRKKVPAASSSGDRGPVIVWSYIHHKTKKRVEAKNGKPFCFYPKKKAA